MDATHNLLTLDQGHYCQQIARHADDHVRDARHRCDVEQHPWISGVERYRIAGSCAREGGRYFGFTSLPGHPCPTTRMRHPPLFTVVGEVAVLRMTSIEQIHGYPD